MATRSQPRRPRTGSTTPKTAFQPEIRQYAMTKRSQLSRADRRSKFVIGPWSFFRHLSSRWPSGYIGISHSPHTSCPSSCRNIGSLGSPAFSSARSRGSGYRPLNHGLDRKICSPNPFLPAHLTHPQPISTIAPHPMEIQPLGHRQAPMALADATRVRLIPPVVPKRHH